MERLVTYAMIAFGVLAGAGLLLHAIAALLTPSRPLLAAKFEAMATRAETLEHALEALVRSGAAHPDGEKLFEDSLQHVASPHGQDFLLDCLDRVRIEKVPSPGSGGDAPKGSGPKT